MCDRVRASARPVNSYERSASVPLNGQAVRQMNAGRNSTKGEGEKRGLVVVNFGGTVNVS